MAKNKPPRDPGAPKRNMSAYLLYQNAMRETFKAQNPGMTFGQLSKYTSAMYAEMPVSEKEAWQARAEADKARYLHELAGYVPPPGYDAKGDAIIQHQKAGRKGGKNVRDANAPKRNMSAYLLYQNAMRDQFRAENPGMTFGQLAKYTSHMYRSLTPEEKATWEARAAQDKARYNAGMAAYVPPPGHDAQGNLMEDYKYGKKQKKARDPNAPKRARGSFVFFTFDVRPQIMKEMPDIKFVDLGTVMGERWRALSPEDKKRYEDMASEDKCRFNHEMQEYQSKKAAAQAQHQAEAVQSYQDPHAAQAAAAQAQHAAAMHHHLHHQQQQMYHDPNSVYSMQAAAAAAGAGGAGVGAHDPASAAAAYAHDPSAYQYHG